MSNTITSPNMGMPIPVPGVDTGPDWANNINASLQTVDSHTHLPGAGVPITPAALNINSDLTFLSNNAIALRSARFTPQSAALAAASDLGCLYEVGVDLYFNDGNGNQIRITQSGGIAGSPGSIANLTSPASASYVALSTTFVWQSDVSTSAIMDAGSYIMRNATASSKGLTLQAPLAMAADYTIILPALPSAQKIMTLDNSGNMTAPVVYPLVTASYADASITNAKLAALGQQISSSCGSYSNSTTSPTDVTNLSVTITTVGRPVFVALIDDGTNSGSELQAASTLSTQPFAGGSFTILRGVTNITNAQLVIGAGTSSSGQPEITVPVGTVFTIDPVAAGTYTYKVQAVCNGTHTTVSVTNAKLIAYEL